MHHPYLGIKVQPQQGGRTQSGVPISEEKQIHIPGTEDHRRRILGLPVPAFRRSFIIGLAIIIAGAIGGGLSAKRGTTKLPEKPAQPPTDNGGTVTTLLPIVIPSTVPTDRGCSGVDSINGTTYTPLEKVHGTGAMAGITLQGQTSP